MEDGGAGEPEGQPDGCGNGEGCPEASGVCAFLDASHECEFSFATLTLGLEVWFGGEGFGGGAGEGWRIGCGVAIGIGIIFLVSLI